MIIEYIGDVAETGSMLARHIGSSFGLRNDFGSGGKDDNRNDDSGFSCTGINGLMDYYWCDGFFHAFSDGVIGMTLINLPNVAKKISKIFTIGLFRPITHFV